MTVQSVTVCAWSASGSEGAVDADGSEAVRSAASDSFESGEAFPREHVILLHGLSRSAASFAKMEAALAEAGYSTDNRDYPSRTASIMDLAESAIGAALECPEARRASRVHFVTHSMGGILVRGYISQHKVERLGYVVMLGPPNQGSEVIDQIGAWSVVEWFHGPAGKELGTGPDSLPNQLGPVDYPVGIIAGDRSINWINSLMLPGPDDGKVTVERTRVAGMSDHLVVHATHPMMMRNRTVIAQALHFLKTGGFDHREP